MARVRVSRVLHALSDLAPSAEQRSSSRVIPTEWFQWLPLDAVRLFLPAIPDVMGPRSAGVERTVTIGRKFGERLAAVDQVRPAQRSLRVGWLFVAGRTVAEDGRSWRVFHPLVTVPVRVDRLLETHLVPAGDAEVSELVTDRAVRQELERGIELGGGALQGMAEAAVPAALLARLDRLRYFARSAATAAGLPATDVVPGGEAPDRLMRPDRLQGDALVIVAGTAVYAIHETGGTSRSGSLRTWAGSSLGPSTAFHWLYLDGDELPPAPPGSSPADFSAGLDSPYVLTPVQQEAVARSRHDPVTLVSGAPGTGKSHTLAAIACDAVARGQRVLVAAKSDATVDALLDLFERAPGPDPVVFGSNERREALAERLSGGQLVPATEAAISSALEVRTRTEATRARLRMAVADRLRAEVLLDTPEDEVHQGRLRAPGLFDPSTDLAAAAVVLAKATAPGPGWWARRRRRKAERVLRRLTAAVEDVDLGEVPGLLATARSARLAADLVAQGGPELGGLWEELRAADDKARAALGEWLAADSRSARRLNRSSLAAVSALATALRSGRWARRQQLSRLHDDRLTWALPLWVGTLGDIDDLLPSTPALFDLVILDEASSIDQVLAAPALLRGARAVVAGDPHQLRHVSFLSDDHLRTVLAAHQLEDSPVLAARLDVRRNSIFDVAAGAASVLVLDEHFRSDPHLVDFVARRLYGGRVRVATRSPTTESRDCVDVVRTAGARDESGVVRAEVDRTMLELRHLLRDRARSVGVVTPFRAQADALEAAALAAFDVDQLEALDLRIGTVHAFQGNERDVVIASFGLGPADTASWRFVEDPHLFAVFMTRAKRRLIVLVSADPPPGGLVEAYLAQADCPPGRPRSGASVGPWTTAIAHDLEAAGLGVTTAYPSGRHLVDLCLDLGPTRSIGIECEVHPDGPEAHIRRHLDLARAGWELHEAYRSRWSERRPELIVRMVEDYRPPVSPPPPH